MVAVAVHNAHQGTLLAGARLLGREPAVREFGPDQDADPIGNFVIPGIRRLDVAAQAVEAELLGLAELVFQKLDRRRRADRVGIVILIERAAQVERFAVEKEFSIARLDGTKSERLPGFVDDATIPGDAYVQLIQM